VSVKNIDGAGKAALYAYDANNDVTLRGGDYTLTEDWTELEFKIPAGNGACIDEIGVSVYTCRDVAAVLIDDFLAEGEADYNIDFNKEQCQIWTGMHRTVGQFTTLRGLWTLNDGIFTGTGPSYSEAYTGNIEWSSVDFTATVIPLLLDIAGNSGSAGIGFRVQGAMRCYGAVLENGVLALKKNVNGKYITLASAPFVYETGKPCELRAVANGADIRVYANGVLMISYTDGDRPYLTGCIGALLAGGARAGFKDFIVKAR
jgi:hypothetical protein